jgi:hypothetical protein
LDKLPSWAVPLSLVLTLPLLILLIQYKFGLVWGIMLASFALGFRILNTFVNARGSKLGAKYPTEIHEENPLWRVMEHYLGFWPSQLCGTLIFLITPTALLWVFYGPEIALAPVACIAPLSFVIFLNDLGVVRRVEERTERYNKG